MQIKLILLCLIAHVLGDYYFQNDEMSQLKKEKISGVIKHSVYYSIPFIAVWIFINESFKLLIFLCLTHFIIDFIKYIVYKMYTNKLNYSYKNILSRSVKPWIIYLFDQLLHIISIFILVYYFSNSLDINFTLIEKILNIDILFILKWILIIICIHKPANITFKKIFSNNKPKEKSVNNNKNGAIIGFLERFIIAIFLYVNQYSAIGFVLTAKSIARYNKISENAEFGEYYLIGTLYSTLFIVVIFNLIF